MADKVKVVARLETTKELKDLKGWGIPKGTVLGVVKVGPQHPREDGKVHLVRVDNGTVESMGNWSLCPETAVMLHPGDFRTIWQGKLKTFTVYHYARYGTRRLENSYTVKADTKREALAQVRKNVGRVGKLEADEVV